MKRLNICNLPMLLLSMSLGTATLGEAIELRVSFKFILDSSGQRPASGKINTPEEIQEYIDYGNWVLARAGRGYQLRLAEIVDVPGQSDWFNMDALDDGDDDDGVSDPVELKTAVFDSFSSGVNAFLYNPDAINIYIVNGSTDGSCPCGIRTAPEVEDLIVLSQNLNPDWVVLHEIGHFLGLSHTQHGSKTQNDDGSECEGCGCSKLIAGDDGIEDTLPDHECWDTADLISINNFSGRLYASLSPSEQLLVGNTLSNIMSYHGSSAAPRDAMGEITGPADRGILTSDQLDRITDWSNVSRAYVATGRTYFVDLSNTDSETPDGGSHPFELVGSWFGGPLTTIVEAVTRASEEDIVLIRPGTYTDTTVFDKAMTFRATRGNAIITY